jgi:hypothetical protein
LVVEDDEVARLEVEAVELVAGGLGVEDVFEDDEGCAARGGRDALADLSREALVERLGMCRYHDLWRISYLIGPNLPNRSNSSSGVTL